MQPPRREENVDSPTQPPARAQWYGRNSAHASARSLARRRKPPQLSIGRIPQSPIPTPPHRRVESSLGSFRGSQTALAFRSLRTLPLHTVRRETRAPAKWTVPPDQSGPRVADE